MRNALMIASLDYRRLRIIPIAAAACGIMVLFMRFLPSVRNENLAELTMIAALVVAFSFGAVAALSSGAMLFARELSEKRLSFLYARPLSTVSILTGKGLATAGLVVTSFVAGYLPSLFIYWRSIEAEAVATSQAKALFSAIFGVLLLMVVLASFAHLVTIGFNDKSLWLLINFAALTIGFTVIVSTVRQFMVPGITFVSTMRLFAAPWMAVLSVLIASVVIGAARGRALLRSVHRATAITFATGMTAIVVTVISLAWWVTHPGLEDIVIREIVASPDDKHAIVIGSRWGVPSAFLINTTDASEPVFLGAMATDHTFSDDGRSLVFLSHTADDQTVQRHLLGSERPIRTTLTAPRSKYRTQPFALSPDGRHLARLGQNIEIYDLDDRDRLVKSIPVPAEVKGERRIEFLDGDSIYFIGNVEEKPAVVIDSVFTNPTVSTTRLRPHSIGSFTSADNTKLKIRIRGDANAQNIHRVHDMATGEMLWQQQSNSIATMFLPNGGLLVSDTTRGMTSFSVYDSSLKSITRRVALKGPYSLGAAVSADEVTLFTRWGVDPKGVRTTYLFNWTTGAIRVAARGLVPASGYYRYTQHREPAPGSLPTRLFRDMKDQSALLFNPVTGEKKPLTRR